MWERGAPVGFVTKAIRRAVVVSLRSGGESARAGWRTLLRVRGPIQLHKPQVGTELLGGDVGIAAGGELGTSASPGLVTCTNE